MKRIILFIVFMLFTSTIIAQEKSTDTIATDKSAMKSKGLQSLPEYPGGLKEFYNFLIPKIQRSFSYTPGKMLVSFVIERDGTLSNIKTEKGINEKFDQRVRELIAKSPKWIPGQQEGKPLKVFHRVPFEFN